MQPPKRANAPMAGRGAGESGRFRKPETSESNPTRGGAQVPEHLQLKFLMQDWQREMETKVARARLVFELIGTDLVNERELFEELDMLRRCTRALKWLPEQVSVREAA